MCLSRVIGRKVLQEDTPCFGVVELTEDGDASYYRHNKIVANEKGMIYADTVDIIQATSFSIIPNDKEYKAGFHRFLKVEDAEKRKSGSNEQCAIRRYIILKGTEITMGVEDGKYVIVTPTLQLVRVSKTKVKEKENVEFLNVECEPIAEVRTI